MQLSRVCWHILCNYHANRNNEIPNSLNTSQLLGNKRMEALIQKRGEGQLVTVKGSVA
jgi:hypothetical protein